jgi:hypothetical protein
MAFANEVQLQNVHSQTTSMPAICSNFNLFRLDIKQLLSYTEQFEAEYALQLAA